ncbi:MAG: hypothetical protein ACXW1Q_05890 [Halobacteriota archaeon]
MNAGPKNGSSASGPFLRPSSTAWAAARVPASSGARACVTASRVGEEGGCGGSSLIGVETASACRRSRLPSGL